jgi:hypothetical protein
MIRYGKEHDATPLQIALTAAAGRADGSPGSVIYEGLMQLHAELSVLEEYLSSDNHQNTPLNDQIVTAVIVGLEQRTRALAALAWNTMKIEWLPGIESEVRP